MPIVVFICYIVVTATGYLLRSLNLRHLKRHGHEVPQGFEDAVDAATLARSSDYTLAQNRLGLVESMLDNLLLILFMFGGVVVYYDRWLGTLSGSFVWSGVLFFLLLTLAQGVIDIPFSLYGTFRIENRFGFNTMTLRLWATDLLKSTLISIVLTGVVLAGAFAIINWSPALWWLWVWLFFAVVSIFLMYVSPYLIEPLFYKFQPVQDSELEAKIRTMADKAGLKLSRIMQMDASRRSRHSNAYFTGIGRVKRIVLYDTLIEQMSHDEVLAILAHEIGHWKNGHLWKRLVTTELTALAALWICFRLLSWGGVPGLIGLPPLSFAAQLTIIGFLSSLVTFPFTPLSSWLSRRHEQQADRFAVELSGLPHALASALVKLSKENLSNLHPHPLYAAFHYSHPPTVERVRRLRETQVSP
jgi:STE24 endopeptidase